MRQHELAVKWLLESGIQAQNGGFHGWYDTETETYPFLYSEATGYGISTLIRLGETEKATLAAEWLIKNAYWKDLGFRSYYFYRESTFRPAMYSFDNAVCLNALLDLYGVTKKHRYLEYAWRVGDFILRFQEPNGRFAAVFPPQETGRWSARPGCYHAKNAIPLFRLSEVVGEGKYEGAARRVCEWTLKRQKPDGSFPVTELHPHCYAAEGLLYAGVNLSEIRFFVAAEKAVNHLLLREVKRPDVLAQKIILMDKLGLEVSDRVSDLLTFQRNSGGKRVAGGFMFNDRHVNSWTTMFALEALNLWLHL